MTLDLSDNMDDALPWTGWLLTADPMLLFHSGLPCMAIANQLHQFLRP